MRHIPALVLFLACHTACTDEPTDTGSSSITAPVVATDPAESARSDQNVNAVIEVESEGAGDITYTYSWLSDDGEAWPQEQLAASATTKGQTWTVTVTPHAGDDTGPSGQAELSIVNGPPTVSEVLISPSAPVVADTLSCTPTGSDPDYDALTWTYSWSLNGSVVSGQTGSSLNGGFVYNDSITCTATADDGSDSTSLTSASVLVLNTPPTISGVSISPNVATAAVELTCGYANASDDDGQTVTVSYAWTIDGNAAGTGATLAAGSGSRGQTATCTATPNDSVADGTPSSASLIFANTPPAVTNVVITPTAPAAGESLTCNATGSDLDNDSLTWAYSWSVDGSVFTGQSLTSGAASGQTVTCTATASDSYDTTGATSAAVTVSNAPPNAFAATVNPNFVQAQTDDLICVGTTTDPDGDAISYTAIWQFEDYAGTAVSWTTGVENSGINGRTNDVVNAAHTVAGRRFRCQLVATDGNGSTIAANSDWRSVGSPPGCGGLYDGVNQLAGPYAAYGACFYSGGYGKSCDETCDDAGQTNVSNLAYNLWPDACSGGPTDADPVKWFYDHGNPANTAGTPWNFGGAGLGYTRNNQVYTGKCTTGTPIYGTLPNTLNSDANVSPICACEGPSVSR